MLFREVIDDYCKNYTKYINNPAGKCRVEFVVFWSEFLATDPEVPGPIPGATRFSEKLWVWNGVHSAS
jgi:hypothetical protein